MMDESSGREVPHKTERFIPVLPSGNLLIEGEKWLKTITPAQNSERDVVFTDDQVNAAYDEYTSAIKNR